MAVPAGAGPTGAGTGRPLPPRGRVSAAASTVGAGVAAAPAGAVVCAPSTPPDDASVMPASSAGPVVAAPSAAGDVGDGPAFTGREASSGAAKTMREVWVVGRIASATA